MWNSYNMNLSGSQTLLRQRSQMLFLRPAGVVSPAWWSQPQVLRWPCDHRCLRSPRPLELLTQSPVFFQFIVVLFAAVGDYLSLQTSCPLCPPSHHLDLEGPQDLSVLAVYPLRRLVPLWPWGFQDNPWCSLFLVLPLSGPLCCYSVQLFSASGCISWHQPLPQFSKSHGGPCLPILFPLLLPNCFLLPEVFI